MLITFLMIFGLYKSCTYLLGLFSTLRRCFLRKGMNFIESYKITSKSWCIITGRNTINIFY